MYVYLLTNKINGKQYVGQTICGLEQRWHQHKSLAKANSGQKKFALHLAIAKYGHESFEKAVLQVCSTLDELNIAEASWIQHLNCISPNGYNLLSGGGNLGRHSKESIAKMSAAATGQFISEERRAKVSLFHGGLKKPRSVEHEEKLVASRRGKSRSDEAKLRMSLAKKGRVFSEEHRAKLSKAHVGVKKPRTPEHQAKLVESRKLKNEQRRLQNALSTINHTVITD